MKRVFVLILALLMILPLCMACGDTSTPENTTAPAAQTSAAANENSSSDETTAVTADVPENLNFNYEVSIAHWSDYTMTEFYVEEDTGNGIDSAIFKRNLKLEQYLGVTLKYTSAKGASGATEFTTMVRNDFNADADFDIYASYSRTIPELALQGLCLDLNTTKYFDVEKPWWPNVLTNECTINNKLYFASGDISTNLLWMMIATFYNKTMYEDYKSNSLFAKSPEQLVKDNEWTMEHLFNMTKDVYIDLTGDGKTADDTFGMVLFDTNIDAYQTAAGITSVINSKTEGLQINPEWNGEYTQNVVELVGQYLNQAGVWHKDSTAVRSIFNEERALFIMDRTFIVAGKDNASAHDKIEFSFGVVPNPKYSTEQETYLTNMGHPFTMYGISLNSKNYDAASATLELLGAYSYELVTPQVFENTMKLKYADGFEAADMYDIVRENVSFDLGRLYASTFGNSTANQFRNSAISVPSGFLSALKQNQKTYRTALNKLNDAFGK